MRREFAGACVTSRQPGTQTGESPVSTLDALISHENETAALSVLPLCAVTVTQLLGWKFFSQTNSQNELTRAFRQRIKRKADFCHGICYGAGGNSTYLGVKTSIKSRVFGDIFSLRTRRLQVQVLPDAPLICKHLLIIKTRQVLFSPDKVLTKILELTSG